MNAHLLASLTAAAGLWLATAPAGAQAPAAGSEPAVPQLCRGRSDPNVVVNAHAIEPKFILNLTTDALGMPYGVLILDRGGPRLQVELFCRLWRHLPGQPKSGKCDSGSSDGEVPEGATIVHAIGLGQLADGTEIIVRVDARETDEGRSFRVRYKARGVGHSPEAPVAPAESAEGHDGDDSGCEDDGWTRIPAEGWLPLKSLKVRTEVPE